MVVQSKGAIVVLDDGGPEGADLVTRVQGVWPQIYRMTDHDEPSAEEHIVNVGSKHLDVKTVVRTMYEEEAYFGIVPSLLDPVETVADLLSSARGYLADGFPAFVLISGRPANRYRKIAAVLDPAEPITTGSLTLAAVALAYRTGAAIDALLLGGDPDNPPDTFSDVRAMFNIREGAEMLQQAEDLAEQLGIRGQWRTLGMAASRDQLVLDAVREGGYDLVVDDLRQLDVGPRIGRKKRVYRQLVDGDHIDTAYRLLRDAPCDVAVVVDAVRMQLIPRSYAKGAAVAALSIGLLGVAARPAAANGSATDAALTTVEAPLDPGAEATDAGQEAAAQAADADEVTAAQASDAEAAEAAPAAVGAPAPAADAIPADVSAEQMASYQQGLGEEQAALQAEQQELAALQQQQSGADSAAEMAAADLAIAQQDLVDAQATQDSAEEALSYAEDSRNTLTDQEVKQAQGSANRAAYAVDHAQDAVAGAEQALQDANAEAAAAADAAAAQQSVVDAQAQNVAQWDAVVAEAETRTDQRIQPVAGYSVTTSYGTAGSNWSSGYHTGSDYAAPSGTEVVAAASGTVVAAGFNGSYGNQVTIQHADGTQTSYAHMSSISVSVGQTVSAGDAIGAVGSTGNSTGPHLHFEAFDAGGERINPETWLAQA